MPRSQNGWPAGTPAQIGGLDTSYIPGTRSSSRPGVRQGYVATVLLWVAADSHRTVEPLKVGHCWGYAYREIRGGESLSNHASGTAIDLNASSRDTARRVARAARERAERGEWHGGTPAFGFDPIKAVDKGRERQGQRQSGQGLSNSPVAV